MRIKTTLLAACAAALIAPAASQAATLGMDGDTLVYSGEGAEGISVLLSSYDDYDTGKTFLRFSDSGADRVLITTGVCQNHQYGGIICERDLNRPIRIEGSSAKDDISIYSTEAVPDSIPVSINGNDGDDRIKDAYDSSAGRVLTAAAATTRSTATRATTRSTAATATTSSTAARATTACSAATATTRWTATATRSRAPTWSTAAPATTTSRAGRSRRTCSASRRSTSRSTASPTTAGRARTTT